MQRRHSYLFPNGRKRSSRLITLTKLLGTACIMFCASVFFSQAHAADHADYKLDIAFDFESKSLKAVAEIRMPAGKGIALQLDNFNINAVILNDEALANEKIGGTLSVNPSTQAQKLTIHYQKSFQQSYSELINKEQGIALTENWHPLPDRDCIFQLQAVVPDNFEAISEADTIVSESTAGNKVVTFSFATAARRIHFLAGPYIIESEKFGQDNEREVFTYFFPEDASLAAQYRQKALGYLNRYEELIGPYPYKRFSIVENRLPTGYAMPTFTLLGQAIVRLPFIVDTSLGHEVLHSWFGNAVRVDVAQGNWCEGLTTYLADQAYEADKGAGAVYRKGQLIKYQSYINDETKSAVKDFVGGDSRRDAAHLAERAVGYGKTSMIFHMLSVKIGQESFAAGLKDFFKRMNGKVAGWQDIIDSFQGFSEDDLSKFFKQWLERNDVPEIYAEKIRVEEKDGELVLTFKLTQKTEQPYALDVPLIIQTSSAELRKTLSTDSKVKDVEFKLNSSPISMSIDPDYDLMRKLETNEMPPVWDWFNGSQKKLVIINSPDEYEVFEPLIDQLEKEGAEIIAANELTDKELAENSLIFLGLSGPASRSLFADPGHPEQGFTVDIRNNPLNSKFPAVLVSAENKQQVLKGAAKLTRYGKYSYLHFNGGHASEKQIKEAASGTTYPLVPEPVGVKVEHAMDFSEIIKQLRDKRVVYLGESHTRYEDHKLQLRIIREMFGQDPKLSIGMEMFPVSVQEALDKYVSGEIDEKTFLKDSNYFNVWRFDYRLYQEILNFARQHKVPVIALNIEKEKTSKVYKEGGISALGPEEMMSIPLDRDLDLPEYKQRLFTVFKQHPGNGGEKQFNGFFQAQAIWDETMAHNIAEYLTKNTESRMAVIAGNGHVLKNNAIPPRVKRRLDVNQAIVMASNGYEVYPPTVDYVVFTPQEVLPPRPLIGIMMENDKEVEGVKIQKVSEKSAAEKAGVQDDDILLALDGEPMTSIDDVRIFMLGKKTGDKLKISILRPHFIFPDEKIDLDIQL